MSRLDELNLPVLYEGTGQQAMKSAGCDPTMAADTHEQMKVDMVTLAKSEHLPYK